MSLRPRLNQMVGFLPGSDPKRGALGKYTHILLVPLQQWSRFPEMCFGPSTVCSLLRKKQHKLPWQFVALAFVVQCLGRFCRTRKLSHTLHTQPTTGWGRSCLLCSWHPFLRGVQGRTNKGQPTMFLFLWGVPLHLKGSWRT